MKLTMITITGLVLLCILVLGCQEENMNKAPDERLMNSKLIEIYSNSSIQNAIISEHTLFPYQFVKNGADLNELGHRDLAVLVRHFAKNGGDLNIRRLGASDELYKARINVVYDELKDAGIDMARISISDGMPDGEGMPSERVLIILEQGTESTGTETSTSYSPEKI